MRFTLLMLLPVVFVAACAGPQRLPEWNDDDPGANEEEREEQREANRAALALLMERAQQRADEPAEPDADTPPDDLPRVVLEPPSTTINPDGSLRTDAVRAFHEAGPHGILGAVDFEVVYLDGQPLGYRINRFRPGGEWIDEAGVNEEDVVTHVNGHRLAVPEAFVDAWDSVPDASLIEVRIWRDGATVELAWPVRDPAP